MEGKVIGTCSHELSSKWFNSGKGQICIGDTDKEGKDCISYLVVCPKCKRWYQRKGLLVKLVPSFLAIPKED